MHSSLCTSVTVFSIMPKRRKLNTNNNFITLIYHLNNNYIWLDLCSCRHIEKWLGYFVLYLSSDQP